MALSYGSLTSTTVNKFLETAVDNVLGSKAFVKELTSPSRLRLQDGGNKIQGPIFYTTTGSATSKWFSPEGTLDSTVTDPMTSFTLDWKYLQEPLRISYADLMKNRGVAAQLSLLKNKTMWAEQNLINNMGTGLFSDGTAATGALTTNQIDGMAAILSESTTYGGIAVADVATWVGNVDDNSSTDRDLTLNLMQTTFGGCSYDSIMPSALISRQNVFNIYWSLLTPTMRIINKQSQDIGFPTLDFNGKPYYVDSHCPAGEIQFVNFDHTFLTVHRDVNMISEKFDKLETYWGILHRIIWMGNLVTQMRRANGKLDDIRV